jgi:hypothetical protein
MFRIRTKITSDVVFQFSPLYLLFDVVNLPPDVRRKIFYPPVRSPIILNFFMNCGTFFPHAFYLCSVP